MLLEKDRVDLQLLAHITSDMVSGEQSKEYWWAFLNGMDAQTNDDNLENLWHMDCVYTKLFGNGKTTSIIGGTPDDILEENFNEIIEYGIEHGYFTIDNVLDTINQH